MEGCGPTREGRRRWKIPSVGRAPTSIHSARMRATVSGQEPREAEADLVVVGVFEGEDLPELAASAPGADDVKAGFKKTALLHPGAPKRVLSVGLGPREEMSEERARVAGAISAREAKELGAGSVAWVVPESGDPAALASALTEGFILATFDTGSLKTGRDADGGPESLVLLGATDAAAQVETARVATEAQNRTRELQNMPSNLATPTRLAQRAEEIAAAHDTVSAGIFGPGEIASKGFGGVEAIAKGSAEEPRVMVLRYTGAGGDAPLGLVGKAVTFDTGGISLKPGASMDEMKFDMSGGAAVLEAVAALA